MLPLNLLPANCAQIGPLVMKPVSFESYACWLPNGTGFVANGSVSTKLLGKQVEIPDAV